MPRVEPIPIPYDQLPEDARARIEAGMATGMFTTPAPLPVVARSMLALRGLDDGYRGIFRQGVLGSRLQELLRIRSAQISLCTPCAASRKDDSVDENTVACLAEPDESVYEHREVLALRFLDLFANDPHAIDDAVFTELREAFDDEAIVELTYVCGLFVGGHRMMHVLGVIR